MNDKKVAFITGSTSGIGLGIAKALINSGVFVILSGRNADKGQSILSECFSCGEADFIAADVLSQVSLHQALDEATERHKGIDILVNNAGGSSQFSPVHQMSDDAWNQAMVWNLTSVFWGCRRVLPAMMEKKFGRIINISSVQGKQVNRSNASHYVASKHGVNGFTKALAKEYGQFGITCNAICVGAVETDLMRSAGPEAAKAAGLSYDEYKQQYTSASMIGRLNTVDEVGAMAALLASENGAGITGSILNVDGGICGY